MSKYVIYLITNQINGKKYVGRTKCGLDNRWSVHKAHVKHGARYSKKYGKSTGDSYLYRSMRKHGIENFSIMTIEEVETFGQMVAREAHHIRLLDTINPNKGYNLVIDEYEKDGVREFTSLETRQKISRSGSTKYNHPTGVSWDKERNKWVARLSTLERSVNKRFDSENDAKIVSDKWRLYHYGADIRLYFPERKEEYLKENLADFCQAIVVTKKSTSRYKGVKVGKDGHVMVRVSLLTGGRLFVGTYSTEEEAVLVYDKVIYHLWKSTAKLNLPDLWNDSYDACGKEIYDRYTDAHKTSNRKKQKTSQYNGVNKRSTYTWEMTVTINRERMREIYMEEIDAARAYDYYIRSKGGNQRWLNFPSQIIDTKPEDTKPMPDLPGFSISKKIAILVEKSKKVI